LKKAYELNPHHTVVLVQLSNYFFSKKEFIKCKALATNAYNSAEKDDIKAESAYILGKLAHAEGRFDDAFHYYYQAHQFNQDSLLPLFGLSQCYIKKSLTWIT
jgi:tetratricopeptide (TPR) repeat protein